MQISESAISLPNTEKVLTDIFIKHKITFYYCDELIEEINVYWVIPNL